MLNPISSALPGLSAAADQFDSSTPFAANDKSRSALPTAGAPISEAAYQPPVAEPTTALTRDGVDGSAAGEKTSGFDSTYASLRSSTPAYLAVYDAKENVHPQQRAATNEIPDPAKERAEKADEEKSRTAAQKTLEDLNALVAKRYDISQSF
jgi:hypothetical protein